MCFGCFSGLAEALDIAEPEPEAPICAVCSSAVRCLGLRAARPMCQVKAGRAEPGFVQGRAANSLVWTSPLFGYQVRNGQAASAPVLGQHPARDGWFGRCLCHGGCPHLPLPNAERKGQHGRADGCRLVHHWDRQHLSSAPSASMHGPMTAEGEQELQAFKCRKRDLRSGAINSWHNIPTAHHSGTKARGIDGRSGLGGVIPNSTTLILHRQRGLP